jgi:hypothetical protein
MTLQHWLILIGAGAFAVIAAVATAYLLRG